MASKLLTNEMLFLSHQQLMKVCPVTAIISPVNALIIDGQSLS